ncbi:hypothetical protein [Stenotrophomonas sp. PFBMAA-4]|uniref:hypothetical protein n=1 Tax=Stenotrophomonas sp. PFBMAA-4 TaxID=3043301 RepID=UPI0024B4E8B6|nr:hypothetical protein [Stenotrophomonas sp. PFBMAA-4]MDI9273135.1 hypothetical protein [Stenotrophomonas sp. PFBMAA-4]
MKTCQYCDLSGDLTKEHVIPNWYYKGIKPKSGAGFSEKARGRLFSGELKIRDVCEKCNNGPLSELDNYGKGLYERHMLQPTNERGSSDFTFDYNLLVRWLLKLSYNSARMTGNDVGILSEYKEVILGTAPIPKNVRVTLKCVSPAMPGEVSPHSTDPNTLDAALSLEPNWFRIGAFRIPSFDTAHWALRHVSINSYFFQIFAPSQATPPTAADTNNLLESLERDLDPSVDLSEEGRVQLPSPFMSSLSHLRTHMEQFPVAYDMPRSDMVDRIVTENPKILHLKVSRSDIESRLLDNTVDVLTELISSREVIIVAKDKLEITVDGYCDDPRELIEIPEVVTFIRDLDTAWPHWLLFCDPQKSWLPLVFSCICGKPLSGGRFEIEMSTVKPTLDRWYIALNDLSNEFAISIEDNRRASDKVRELGPRLKPAATPPIP